MLSRWATRRFWRDDAPRLRQTKGAILKHLEENDPKSSSTEPVRSVDHPADIYTYHYGDGRGARWEDKQRDMLWLLCFCDGHEDGYAHCLALHQAGTLVPDVDPAWERGPQSTKPWGAHPDEDIREWASTIYGALETWEINRAALEAGEAVEYWSAAWLRLRRDEGIWTVSIRRNVAYLSPDTKRGRWLTNGEIEHLFRHIAGFPSRNDYLFEDPPNTDWRFVDVHFLDGPLTPAEWVARVSAPWDHGHENVMPLVGDADLFPAIT